MSGQKKTPKKTVFDSAELRKRAEEKAEAMGFNSPAAETPEANQKMVHELRVHQIELEMQNEELRHAQAEIEAGRARYFDLYDLAPVGYFTVIEKGRILEANLTGATLLGVTRSALVKQFLTRFILKEDQDIYYHRRKQLFETGVPQTFELRMVKRNGATFWARLDVNVAQDADGAPACRVVLSDISKRKRVEQENAKLEAQLHQAQKMESVGRLAGGVAHDFNNMLGIILGYSEMALDEVAADQPLFSELQEIRKAAQRSADLTNQLLTFARKQPITRKVLDLNETVEGILKMLRPLVGENVDLVWLPGTNLWPVKVDPSQIDQLLANLCINAQDAISGVGEITIETKATAFDEAYCAEHTELIPGEYVLLAVTDNGSGMDQETMGHLFEPFFTTKEMGKGTGLGLATVYGMVKQNNGFIDVYSEPGKGTTFSVYLPRYVAETVLVQKTRPSRPAELSRETILLVEDEPAILRMATLMLEKLGYTVVAADTAAEAIRLAHEYTDRIDLLLTDVVMPEMNGRDVAKNLLSFYPGLKRLFMSAYPANIIAHHGVMEEGVHFIQKPFSMNDLAAKVHRVLNAE